MGMGIFQTFRNYESPGRRPISRAAVAVTRRRVSHPTREMGRRRNDFPVDIDIEREFYDDPAFHAAAPVRARRIDSRSKRRDPTRKIDWRWRARRMRICARLP